MSSKRKFSEYDAEQSVAGGAREHTYQNSRHKKNKGTSLERPDSINWLKKRARTIERRLNREDSLPANVKHELEKELDHHRHKLEDLADKKKRSAMIQKYHMVRFFERKKADRLARQIRTQLKTTSDKEERKKLEADLHIAEVDALYAKFFPHRERYVSLYPVSSGSTKAEDASTAARSLHSVRPPLWGTIEEAAKEGNATLVRIQERKSASDSRSKQPQKQASKQSVAARGDQVADSTDTRKGKGKNRQEPEPADLRGDDDSDGGFFEEG
ncbi:hypothetical protein F4802DRAFT_461766 [Xylaria palmicola]|nr:hypothetical protein F4802DRAFT_461766 [Xylaria palmicola]